jgi:PEP-CTERM motif
MVWLLLSRAKRRREKAMLRTLAVALGLSFAHVASAGAISGFESGLAGWTYVGDVSVQGAGVGVTPTEGSAQALLTTVTTASESFSGTPASIDVISLGESAFAKQLFDLPPNDQALADYWGVPSDRLMMFSSIVKTEFSAVENSLFSFDWNFVTTESSLTVDGFYYTVWSEDTGFRAFGSLIGSLDTLGLPADASGLPTSGLDLCAREPFCNRPTLETGWETTSIVLPDSGRYDFGLFVIQAADGIAFSALTLDNLRLQQVPEPTTLALLSIGALALRLRRR